MSRRRLGLEKDDIVNIPEHLYSFYKEPILESTEFLNHIPYTALDFLAALESDNKNKSSAIKTTFDFDILTCKLYQNKFAYAPDDSEDRMAFIQIPYYIPTTEGDKMCEHAGLTKEVEKE